MKKAFVKAFHLTAIASLLYGYYLASQTGIYIRYSFYFDSISLQGYLLTLLVSIVQLLMSEAPKDKLSEST